MIVRWTTDIATNSRVYYSTDPANQNLTATHSAVVTDHSVTVTGLNSNTQYYYKVGSSTEVLSSRFRFFSPPDNGHPSPDRFWILGDSGNKEKVFRKIVQGYTESEDFADPNLIVLLGDNAYDTGTDVEYQSKLFDILGPLLTGTIVVSTLGDRDTNAATNPPSDLPYFQIFNLPFSGTADGHPSGTEKYYSFNFGIVHWVVLDSMASDRSANGPMLNWLREDLENNRRPWLIALWHHSPYSSGNHHSDEEIEMTEMRENANQILEDFGVDLVLGAHSNVYERSYLIDGHYGSSDTFVTSMVINDGDGSLTGDGAYEKAAAAPHGGTVYTVLGVSSGKANRTKLNYPAMAVGTRKPGSIVIDLNCDQMNVQFMTKKGKVKDSFTIVKQDILPNVSIVGPTDGSTFNAPANILISADASDPDTRIRKVRFLSNDVLIDQDFSPPYEVNWTQVGPGTYTLRAVAEDELCKTRTSVPVNITVQ